MTPKLMALAAVLVLTVVFLSPIAYLAGQRAGVWLTDARGGATGPWPSVDEGERERATRRALEAAGAPRLRRHLRAAASDSRPGYTVTTSPSYAHSSGTEAACASISAAHVGQDHPPRPDAGGPRGDVGVVQVPLHRLVVEVALRDQ